MRKDAYGVRIQSEIPGEIGETAHVWTDEAWRAPELWYTTEQDCNWSNEV